MLIKRTYNMHILYMPTEFNFDSCHLAITHAGYGTRAAWKRLSAWKNVFCFVIAWNRASNMIEIHFIIGEELSAQ